MSINLNGVPMMGILNIFECAERALNIQALVHYTMSNKLYNKLKLISSTGGDKIQRSKILKDIEDKIKNILEQSDGTKADEDVVYNYYTERLKIWDKDKEDFLQLVKYPIENKETHKIFTLAYSYAYYTVSETVYQDTVNLYVPDGLTKDEENHILEQFVKAIKEGKDDFYISAFYPSFIETKYYLKDRNGLYYRVLKNI